jgi:hypothetical protein
VDPVTPTQGPRREPAASPDDPARERVAAAQREDLAAQARIAREVAKLQAIDRRVRAHEQAHMAASGGLVRGGASYSYTVGPDGRRYAVAGEVSIDTSEVPNDPEATLQKAERIRRAALAPADPSAQDMRVAAQASAMAREARAELARERAEQLQAAREPSSPGERVDLYA